MVLKNYIESISSNLMRGRKRQRRQKRQRERTPAFKKKNFRKNLKEHPGKVRVIYLNVIEKTAV